MPLDCDIRHAGPDDAPAISEVILAALRETNARDYTPEIIARVGENFTPPRVVELIRTRKVLVALAGQRVIGTATLEGEWVRTVFVAPDAQGNGVGRRLMTEIEDLTFEEALLHARSVVASYFRHINPKVKVPSFLPWCAAVAVRKLITD